jgi:hypothetical protein
MFSKISSARFASISQTDDSGQNFRISLWELQYGKSNFTQEKIYKIQFVVQRNVTDIHLFCTHMIIFKATKICAINKKNNTYFTILYSQTCKHTFILIKFSP